MYCSGTYICFLYHFLYYDWLHIGVGRFRILGGPRGGGGLNSQQAHDVIMTSMRRNDVTSTSFRRHVPTRFLINQCQIITFILKSDIIENSRIELRGIVLPVSWNQIKVTFIIILPFNLVHLWIFLLHIEIEGKGEWIIGGGGQRVCWPPPKLWGGGLAPLPPPPHSSYSMLQYCFILWLIRLSMMLMKSLIIWKMI